VQLSAAIYIYTLAIFVSGIS